MLSEEEWLSATSGSGFEIASYRMAASEADKNPLESVEHVLAAIEALTLHLQHVHAASDQFKRQMVQNQPPRLPRVPPAELSNPN